MAAYCWVNMGFGDHYLLRGATYGLTDDFLPSQHIHLDLIFVPIDKNLLHADFNQKCFCINNWRSSPWNLSWNVWWNDNGLLIHVSSFQLPPQPKCKLCQFGDKFVFRKVSWKILPKIIYPAMKAISTNLIRVQLLHL